MVTPIQGSAWDRSPVAPKVPTGFTIARADVGMRDSKLPNLRSHLPRNRTRSVNSSPSPSPPPSPSLQPVRTSGPANSVDPNPPREKRWSFSTRQAVGARPTSSRRQSAENHSAERTSSQPEEGTSKHRRESHSSSRWQRASQSKPTALRLELQNDSEAPTALGDIRTWQSYSTHAEASVSSPGGLAEDDEYSSSDTENGDERIFRNPPVESPPMDNRAGYEYDTRQDLVESDGIGMAASSGVRANPILQHGDRPQWIAQHGLQSLEMAPSRSNDSESDASRLSVTDRLREMVNEVRGGGSPTGARSSSINKAAKGSPLSSVFRFSMPMTSTTAPSQTHSTRRPAKPLPSILPHTIQVGKYPLVTITRQGAERSLLIGSMLLAVWRLQLDMGARTEAIELSLLTGLATVYLAMRSTKTSGYGNPCAPHDGHPVPSGDTRSTSAHDIDHGNSIDWIPRDSATQLLASTSSAARMRKSHEPSGMIRNSLPPHSTTRHENSSNRLPTLSDVEDASIGSKGLVWATGDRNYRDCIDDGAAFALLLGPLLAASMYYTTWQTLTTNPAQTRTSEWNIEPPQVLDSTPSPMTAFSGSLRIPDNLEQRNPAILALTALCLSRQHLVHLTCLLSLILIVHTTWSRRQDLRMMKGDPSNVGKGSAGAGSRWVKLSEWRRSLAIIAFSLVVTAFVVGLKGFADVLGLAEGYDLTYPDIVIATLFFQFSLYVSIRLARRGFTLGELGIVCHSATVLFMETVNLTRTRIRVFSMPYIKTYRLPTPLLIFQLALIPGSLLTGFLLSPLLVLSRKIAQRPAHRLRYPQEKELYRKALAAGFYLGAAAICGGLVGFWVKWLLDWRDPWVWVAFWLMEGRHWWSRPFLIGYWALLAAISVGGWTRQLSRARKRRAWSTSTNTNGHSKISIHNRTAQATSSHQQTQQKVGPSSEPRFAQVATQMMDAANQKLPVLSINARRKFFHALATAMFIPGIAIDPAFTHLAFSLAFAAFNFAEYVRYFALYPFGAAVHLFLNEFLDESKDGGTAILSHFYLLTGCASGVWLEGPKTILSVFGALALGIGDALASIVGKRIGKLRWSSTSGKTVEGTVAFVTSVVATGSALMLSGAIGEFSIPLFTLMTTLVALMEALSEQNDNLTLPIWGWCLGVLLRL